MTNQEWRITFSKLGQPESVIKAHPGKPSIATAAELISNHVFGDDIPEFPLLPCDEGHLELSRLETHGWTIVKIEEHPH
ncbi:MAG: hypothetical protein JWP38_3658 [Herbaspirillum sp.]|jgi:hypothetical protein|nr:hypothetical protein [Herbaspirillum sp.]